MRGSRVAGVFGVAVIAGTLAALGVGGGPARAETVQSNGIRIGFSGGLEPRLLPRSAPAPLRLSLVARIAGADGAPLPRLRSLAIAVNRAGHLSAAGLPVCRLRQIQPATTLAAEEACGAARVGTGSFAARVELAEQAPYPSRGRIVAYNGRYRGRPAILLHVYGRAPVPTSYTLPLTVSHHAGTFATVLHTSIAASTPSAGRVTRLALHLGRSYTFRGRRRSYLSGVCPAPPRLDSTRLPLLHTRLGFAGRALAFTVSRGCAVAASAVHAAARRSARAAPAHGT
jgi:hypothetical protein